MEEMNEPIVSRCGFKLQAWLDMWYPLSQRTRKAARGCKCSGGRDHNCACALGKTTILCFLGTMYGKKSMVG